MHSHDVKVNTARQILTECNGHKEHLFLRLCYAAGITQGHRDTQDELFEFVYNVCKDVPGSIHAIRKSLVAEIDVHIGVDAGSSFKPLWRIEKILRRLAIDGNAATAAAIYERHYPIMAAIDEKANALFERVQQNVNLATKSVYLNNRLTLVRHASAYAPLSARSRMARIGALMNLYVAGDDGIYKGWVVDAIAANIGMIGLSHKECTRVMNPARYWQYRIPAVAAVIALLWYRYDRRLVAKLWDEITLARAQIVRDKSGGNVLPDSDKIFTGIEVPDWSAVGAMVPSFYHGFTKIAGGYFIQGSGFWMPMVCNWQSDWVFNWGITDTPLIKS